MFFKHLGKSLNISTVILIVLAIGSFAFISHLDQAKTDVDKKRTKPFVLDNKTLPTTIPPENQAAEAIKWNFAELKMDAKFPSYEACSSEVPGEPSGCQLWRSLGKMQNFAFNSPDDVIAALNNEVLSDVAERNRFRRLAEQLVSQSIAATRIELGQISRKLIPRTGDESSASVKAGREQLEQDISRVVQERTYMSPKATAEALAGIITEDSFPGASLPGEPRTQSPPPNVPTLVVNVDLLIKRIWDYYQQKVANELSIEDQAVQDRLAMVQDNFREPLRQLFKAKSATNLRDESSAWIAITNNSSSSSLLYKLVWLTGCAIFVFTLLLLAFRVLQMIPGLSLGVDAISDRAKGLLDFGGGGQPSAVARGLLVAASAIGIGGAVVVGSVSGTATALPTAENATVSSNYSPGASGGDRAPNQRGAGSYPNWPNPNVFVENFVPEGPESVPGAMGPAGRDGAPGLPGQNGSPGLNGNPGTGGTFALTSDDRDRINKFTEGLDQLADAWTKYPPGPSQASVSDPILDRIARAIGATSPFPTPASTPSPSASPAVTATPAGGSSSSASPSIAPNQTMGSNPITPNDKTLYQLVDEANAKLTQLEALKREIQRLNAASQQAIPPGGGNLRTRLGRWFGGNMYLVTPAAYERLITLICPGSIAKPPAPCGSNELTELAAKLTALKTAGPLTEKDMKQKLPAGKNYDGWRQLILNTTRLPY